MTETLKFGTLESNLRRIKEKKARDKELDRIVQAGVDEFAEIRFKFEAPREKGIPEGSNLATRRECGTFDLLQKKGPEYNPTTDPRYDAVVRMRARGEVSDVIAIQLDIPRQEVNAMLQYAVVNEDLSMKALYARLPTNCSKEDFDEARRMRAEGYTTNEIVYTLRNKKVRISKRKLCDELNK